MGAIETLRDALFGNPPSQTTEPSREGVLKAFEETVQSINSVVGGIFTEDASAVYAARATLFSNLNFPDRTLGVVYADANSDYIGIYVKNGVSGSGSWTFTGLLGRGPGPTDGQVYLAYQEYVDQISADVDTAQSAAAAAAVSEAAAESLIGPTYASTGAGISATTNGEGFAVDNGDGTVTIYLNDAGVADEQRKLATSAALGGPDGGKFIGLRERTHDDRLLDVVNILDEGVVSDGTTACGALINDAADKARAESKALVLPRCEYAIIVDEAIDLRGIHTIVFETPLVVDPDIVGIPVQLGGFATGDLCDWWFDDITDGTPVASTAPPSRPIVSIAGLKGSTARFGSCNYFQIYADEGVGESYASTAYNRFFCDGLLSLLEITDGGGFSWVTENQIFASRIDRLRIKGVGYPHNHNLISRSTFEGSQFYGEFEYCSHNKVTSARGEDLSAAPGISFTDDTYSNMVSFGWSGAGNPRNDFVIPCDVTDLGLGNIVTTEAAQLREKVEIANVGAASGILASASSSIARSPYTAPQANPGVDNLTDSTILTPSLNGFSVGAARYIFLTPPIPAALGDTFVWEGEFSGSLIRTATFALDANQRPLTSEGEGGVYIDQPGASASGGYGRYVQSSDIDADTLRQSPAVVVRDEVKFVRLGAFSGAGGFLNDLSVSVYTNQLGRGPTHAAAQGSGPRSLPGAPVAGFVPLGTTVFDRTAEIMRYVTLEYESVTTGALVATNTSVTIAAAGSIADGDLVGILLDNGQTHWSTVSGLTGATFTVAALPSGAASGARVVFNRWAS